MSQSHFFASDPNLSPLASICQSDLIFISIILLFIFSNIIQLHSAYFRYNEPTWKLPRKPKPIKKKTYQKTHKTNIVDVVLPNIMQVITSEQVSLFEVHSYWADKWRVFFGNSDVRQDQNGARPKRRALAAIFVIPCSSFRLVLQQEALKSLYWFWQKSSRVGGCVSVRARVCVVVCVCVGHRVELQSPSKCSMCTNRRVQIPTSKSSLTHINTHTR